jgi:hypothetical protein
MQGIWGLIFIVISLHKLAHTPCILVIAHKALWSGYSIMNEGNI